MIAPIKNIRGVHKGEMIFVMASGKSMDYYPRGFFDNLTTIGVNRVAEHFPCTYTITHHREIIPELLETTTAKILTAKYQRCIPGEGELNQHILEQTTRQVYVYDTPPQGFINIDWSPWKQENTLITAGTIVVSALDAARHLGAKIILCCGVDGIDIHGSTNFAGYGNYKKWDQAQMRHIEATRDMVRDVARKITAEAGVPVVGVNPFVDLRLKP